MRLLLHKAMLLIQSTLLLRPVSAQELGDMESLYTFTPGPAAGNCDQYKASLQTSVSEAIDMVNRSINAINSLEVSLYRIKGAEERFRWKLWAQLLYAMFNIDVEPTRGLNLDDADVKLVKGYFEAMITYQSYEPPPGMPTKYWFFCDDSYIVWKEPPISDELNQWWWPNGFREKAEKYGYWNATGGSAANPYYSFFPGFEGQDTTSYHCHGTTQAFVTTQEWPRTLTLCPAAFQIHPHSAAQNWLQVGTQLHNLETWGTVILHEWGHLINNFVDEPAVDEDGDPIYIDSLNPFRARAVPRALLVTSVIPATTTSTSVKPSSTSSTQARARVYGWNRVIWLATWDPERVRMTPEAYKYFAMAVYYTQTNERGLQFSYGYASIFGEDVDD